MRYVESSYARRRDDLAYRIYITDALKAIGNLDKRYADTLTDEMQEPELTEEEMENLQDELIHGINGD